jgi:hypothetical protein
MVLLNDWLVLTLNQVVELRIRLFASFSLNLRELGFTLDVQSCQLCLR